MMMTSMDSNNTKSNTKNNYPLAHFHVSETQLATTGRNMRPLSSSPAGGISCTVVGTKSEPLAKQNRNPRVVSWMLEEEVFELNHHPHHRVPSHPNNNGSSSNTPIPMTRDEAKQEAKNQEERAKQAVGASTASSLSSSSSLTDVINVVEFITNLLLKYGKCPDEIRDRMHKCASSSSIFHKKKPSLMACKVFRCGSSKVDTTTTTTTTTRKTGTEVTKLLQTILYAIQTGSVNVLMNVHQEHPDLNDWNYSIGLLVENQFGESLFHVACRYGHFVVMQFLVQTVKLNVNVQDVYGRNPLHILCQRPQVSQVPLILWFLEQQDQCWEQVLLCDDLGKTPMEYLSRSTWKQVHDGWIQRNITPLSTK